MANLSFQDALVALGPCAAATALGLAFLAGCEGGVPAGLPPETAPAETEQSAPAAGLRIEQAERQLDVGRDAAGAKAALQAIVADPAVTAEERDQATLALARAEEALGNAKAAVTALEDLLSAHEGDHDFALARVAETQLRKLLTGVENAPRPPQFEDEPVPPVAEALAKFFRPVEDDERTYRPSMVMFNARRGGVSERLGTFNVGGALRKMRVESGPLGDDDVNISHDTSRFGTWTSIAGSRKRIESSLVVVYFDLAAGRVPAHYDWLLPMPSAEVVSRLERGKGVIAAKKRAGAPPVILLAAPRPAQVAEVETYFTSLTDLPAALEIDVDPKLTAEEIQQVVRGGRSKQKGCYETTLGQQPGASGRAVVHFVIRADGTTTDVSVKSEGTVSAAAFDRCLGEAFAGLSFPAAAKQTEVTYPLEFSP
jgi:TonB family protein